MAKRASTNPALEQTGDDLKQVIGIGPAVEKRLQQAGILSYTHLAASQPQELADLLTELVGFSTERIVAQEWTAQARKLADEGGSSPQQEQEIYEGNHLHYASYTLELLLDQGNRVRRTRALHVQSRQEEVWAGWDDRRLNDFLAGTAHLSLLAGSQVHTIAAESLRPPAEPAPDQEGDVAVLVARPVGRLTGTPKIRTIQLFSLAGERLQRMIDSEQPFNVHLTLDLSQIEFPAAAQMEFETSLYMEDLGSRNRSLSGFGQGTAAWAETVEIDFQSRVLLPGEYRLEILATLRPIFKTGRAKEPFVAFAELMPIHVC